MDLYSRFFGDNIIPLQAMACGVAGCTRVIWVLPGTSGDWTCPEHRDHPPEQGDNGGHIVGDTIADSSDTNSGVES